MMPSANGKSTVAWSQLQPCTVLEWLQHTTKAQGFWSHIMIWTILSPARKLDVPVAFSLHPVDIYRSCWMFLEDFMGFHPFWSNGSSVFFHGPLLEKTSTVPRPGGVFEAVPDTLKARHVDAAAEHQFHFIVLEICSLVDGRIMGF